MEYARRGLGAILVLFAITPMYRGLSGASGMGAQQTLMMAEVYTRFLWVGLPTTLAIALLLTGILPNAFPRRILEGLERRLVETRGAVFMVGVGALSCTLTLAIVFLVLDGKPVLLDSVSQLLQGRYLAAGRLAGPPLELPEFLQFQFMLDTPEGWISQYPFGHAMMLALGFKAGVPWLIAPVLVGIAVVFTALVGERLLPDDRLTGRLGALLLAVSPFFLALAGSYMNHVTAAAFGALGIYCALRARDGRPEWALAAGAAVGAVFATRPLTGVVLGTVVTLAVWAGGWIEGKLRGSQFGIRVLLGAMGALPFGVAVAAYQARFFGGPLRFAYLAAWGPNHGLGFHLDPWGNAYGPTEALAYTSADLLGLGTEFLWSTVPVVAVVGTFFLVGGRLSSGVRIVTIWALLPVLANAFYWHHDLVMGPRMLTEAAPAWAILAAAAAVGLGRWAPKELRVGSWGFHPQTAVILTFIMGLGAGLFHYGPQRLLGYQQTQAQSGFRSDAPEPDSLSLVFVHDSWRTRLGARLDAAGMRMDSIQAVLAYYTDCEVQSLLDFGETGRSGPECNRQALSDSRWVLGLPGLIWQGDLPGLSPQGAMFVRDMGPERNQRLLTHFPRRRALALVPDFLTSVSGGSQLIPYDQGMAILWGEDPFPAADSDPGG